MGLAQVPCPSTDEPTVPEPKSLREGEVGIPRLRRLKTYKGKDPQTHYLKDFIMTINLEVI